MSSLRDNNKQCYTTDLVSITDAIDKALECLTSTSDMTIIKLLHLQKLLELSNCWGGRLILRKRYVPRTGDILNMQSSQYIKYKLLEILAITCSVNHECNYCINDLAKDKKLVEFIFCSFAKSASTKNFRLQNTSLELLSSIFHEVSYHENTLWICHMKCEYFLKFDFGSDIINILLQRTEVDVIIAILALLKNIFAQSILDGTNMLERLFKIDNLVVALLKKWSTIFRLSDRCHHYDYNIKKYWRTPIPYWDVLHLWLELILAVTSLPSFECNPCQYDIRIRIVHVLIYILRSFIYILPVNDLTEFYVSNISQNDRQEMTFGPNAPYRNITLLLRFFLVHKNLMNITEVINDIMERINQYIEYNDIIYKNRFLEERGTLRILDCFEEYHEYFSMIERSCNNNMLKEELKWAQHHNLLPNDTYKIIFRVISTSNVQRNKRKCEEEVKLMDNIVNSYSKEQNHSQCTKKSERNVWYPKCLIH